MEEEEQEFVKELEVEGSGYSKKAGFDKAGLIAAAVQNCFVKRGQEMHEGYKTHIQDKLGNIFIKIIPDTRKEFIGAINGLTGLLSFEIQQHIKEEYKKYKEKGKNIKEKYIYRERKFVPKEDERGEYVLDNFGSIVFDIVIIPNGRKWMPEKTDLLPECNTGGTKDHSGNITYREPLVKNVEHVWDYEINQYWNEMLDLHDEWFAELNNLISGRLDNYKSSTGFENKK